MSTSSSDEPRVAEITSRLCELVAGHIGGGHDPGRVDEVKRLATELRPLLPNTALSLRISGLIDAVEVACSPGRWRKAGLDHWRQIAREHAYVIQSHS